MHHLASALSTNGTTDLAIIYANDPRWRHTVYDVTLITLSAKFDPSQSLCLWIFKTSYIWLFNPVKNMYNIVINKVAFTLHFVDEIL